MVCQECRDLQAAAAVVAQAGPRPVGVEPRIGQIARRQRLGQRAGLDQPLHHAGADTGQLRQLTRRKPRAAVIVDHPQHGAVPGVASPLRLSQTPVDYAAAPPALGEHSAQVLAEVLGLDANKIAALEAAGVIACGARNDRSGT